MNFRLRFLALTLVFLLAGCTVVIVDPPSNLPEGEIKVHFIDVGQGDAILIQGTSGQNVLYDGGKNNIDALEYLQGLELESLDLVIASHPDFDHIGGLDVVVENFKPRFFMDNEMTATTNAYADLLTEVKNAGSQVLAPTRRSIGLGEANLEIIPPPTIESYSRNNRSIGVIVDFGDFELALTGDAEPEEFAWWQENTPEYLREVEVYKSAHHGSDNGDNEASMSVWSPETIVIGVGAGNSFGHPTEQVLELYKEAKVYRTDQHGHVIVTAKADGTYTVSTQKTP